MGVVRGRLPTGPRYSEKMGIYLKEHVVRDFTMFIELILEMDCCYNAWEEWKLSSKKEVKIPTRLCNRITNKRPSIRLENLNYVLIQYTTNRGKVSCEETETLRQISLLWVLGFSGKLRKWSLNRCLLTTF